jgi:hypothetical protein
MVCCSHILMQNGLLINDYVLVPTSLVTIIVCISIVTLIYILVKITKKFVIVIGGYIIQHNFSSTQWGRYLLQSGILWNRLPQFLFFIILIIFSYFHLKDFFVKSLHWIMPMTKALLQIGPWSIIISYADHYHDNAFVLGCYLTFKYIIIQVLWKFQVWKFKYN